MIATVWGMESGAEPTRVSAQAERTTRDFKDVDPGKLAADLAQRLAWAERRVELLQRIPGGSAVPGHRGRPDGARPCRVWGYWFTRAAMPALRIPDFHMSSVSRGV